MIEIKNIRFKDNWFKVHIDGCYEGFSVRDICEHSEFRDNLTGNVSLKVNNKILYDDFPNFPFFSFIISLMLCASEFCKSMNSSEIFGLASFISLGIYPNRFICFYSKSDDIVLLDHVNDISKISLFNDCDETYNSEKGIYIVNTEFERNRIKETLLSSGAYQMNSKKFYKAVLDAYANYILSFPDPRQHKLPQIKSVQKMYFQLKSSLYRLNWNGETVLPKINMIDNPYKKAFYRYANEIRRIRHSFNKRKQKALETLDVLYDFENITSTKRRILVSKPGIYDLWSTTDLTCGDEFIKLKNKIIKPKALKIFNDLEISNKNFVDNFEFRNPDEYNMVLKVTRAFYIDIEVYGFEEFDEWIIEENSIRIASGFFR